MSVTLLRIEAMNIHYVNEDTDNLSVRRGGGLMLLYAVDAITGTLITKNGQLKVISSGASIGLYQVLDPDLAESTAKDVRKFLYNTPPYHHATFVVDIATDEDFRKTLEKVIAANRWQHMQSLSFSLVGLDIAATGACKVDGLRPHVVNKKIKGEENTPIGRSVNERRNYGIQQRQAFYQQRILDNEPWNDGGFTDDFHELAADPTHQYGQLGDKIAVFYADGNSFGKRQKGLSPDELRLWDDTIKKQRRIFLAQFLSKVRSEKDWITTDGGVRIETLMWGGDDLLFVVPAWGGLEFVRAFFAAAKKWSFPENSTHAHDLLTHAAGLVFCHCTAPIGRITKLVKSLAETCKNTPDGRSRNLLAWVALESFDHAGMDLDAYLKRRYGDTVTWRDLVLTPDRIDALLAALTPEAKLILPRSALIRALRLLIQGKLDHPLLARSYSNVRDADSDVATAVWKALATTDFPGEPAAAHIPVWVTLLELWDYVYSPKKAVTVGPKPVLETTQ